MVVTIIDKNDYFFLEYAPLIVDQIFRMSILTQFITLHASLEMFIFKYRKVISITFQQIQPAWQFGQMKGFELTDLFLGGSFCRTLILDKRPCWCKCISFPFPLYLFTFLAQIDYNSSHIFTPLILLPNSNWYIFTMVSRLYLVIPIVHWAFELGHQLLANGHACYAWTCLSLFFQLLHLFGIFSTVLLDINSWWVAMLVMLTAQPCPFVFFQLFILFSMSVFKRLLDINSWWVAMSVMISYVPSLASNWCRVSNYPPE